MQRQTDSHADLTKLDQIESAFPRLVLGDKGLRDIQQTCEVLLAKSRSQAELTQDALQRFLFDAEDAFLHIGEVITTDKTSQNRI